MNVVFFCYKFKKGRINLQRTLKKLFTYPWMGQMSILS